LYCNHQNYIELSICRHCKMPSKDKSVKEWRKSSFSHFSWEKSDSTEAVLGNIAASPPAKAQSSGYSVDIPSTPQAS